MARGPRGNYHITPYAKPKRTPGGKPYWLLTGTTLLGDEIDERCPTHAAARYRRNELEEEDEQHRGAPQVLVTALVDRQGIVSDAEAAYALFPRNEKGEMAEHWTLEGAVAFALKDGWDPRLWGFNHTVGEAWPAFSAHIKARGDLAETHPDYLAPSTLEVYERYLPTVLACFEKKLVYEAARPATQKRLIEAANPSLDVQRWMMTVTSVFLTWCLEQKYLKSFRPPWRAAKVQRGQPKIMSPEEIQAWLDFWWETEWAAAGILEVFGALRPSEIEAPSAKLSDDFRVFTVPDQGTKTGTRPVELPPVAQVLLRILDRRKRLKIARLATTQRKLCRGQMGYALNLSAMKTWAAKKHGVAYGELPADQCEREFRAAFPQRFGSWTPDLPRHTGGSYHVAACGDTKATADWMGNEPPVVEAHYRGRIEDLDQLGRFYQTVPTPLKEVLDPSAIALPRWYNRPEAAEIQAQKKEIDDLVAAAVAAAGPAGFSIQHQAAVERKKALARRAASFRQGLPAGALPPPTSEQS